MENPVNLNILRDFLKDMHRGATYRYLWILEQQTGRNQTIWYSAQGKGIEEIINFTSKTKDYYNIFFGVHGTFEKKNHFQRAKETDTLVVNAFYADFDFKNEPKIENISEFIDKIFTKRKKELPRLLPSYIVSSGTGYHAYWVLSEPIIVTNENRDAVKEMQKDWVRRLDADPVACDLARTLRLPFSRNFKYSDKPKCYVKFVAKVKYNIEDFKFRLYLKNQAKNKVTQFVPAINTIDYSRLKSDYVNLESLASAIEFAKEGTRNNTLNRNAFIAFLNFAKNNKDLSIIFDKFSQAARKAGLSEREIEATLNSAFRAAQNKLTI